MEVVYSFDVLTPQPFVPLPRENRVKRVDLEGFQSLQIEYDKITYLSLHFVNQFDFQFFLNVRTIIIQDCEISYLHNIHRCQMLEFFIAGDNKKLRDVLLLQRCYRLLHIDLSYNNIGFIPKFIDLVSFYYREDLRTMIVIPDVPMKGFHGQNMDLDKQLLIRKNSKLPDTNSLLLQLLNFSIDSGQIILTILDIQRDINVILIQ
ncbi:hypothetical protein SS50377_21754 [Spironucleus salmonicida]|uniref:Uncharacterized protein n=1 Tax=Spironucleus salmonicida TaxID=348837 RepID=V6LMF1_9EUKA|nr:hypothetical protein SS50377_21754 [Spironucleus salmonicida]|eukprot:EST45393.1 Hypothetical protein SS50377_14668 [Spironucleus salmonicida]